MSELWDDEDRAIARALGASPDGDGEDAQDQLVDEYRDVLGHMAGEVMPRPGLEDDVVDAALARRAVATPSVDRARSRRTNRIRLAVLAAAAVAAVFVAALIVRDGSTGPSAPNAHVTLANVQRADVRALLR